MRVLFVCTGNSCRSPMAELYFNDLCRKAGRDDISGCSAGTCAWDGARISNPAATVLGELGIASCDFQSHSLTPAMVRNCDLVVAMTGFHRDEIAEIVPECVERLKLLLDFNGGGDVPDPYGGSVDHYRSVFNRMRPALDALAKALFK